MSCSVLLQGMTHWQRKEKQWEETQLSDWNHNGRSHFGLGLHPNETKKLVNHRFLATTDMNIHLDS